MNSKAIPGLLVLAITLHGVAALATQKVRPTTVREALSGMSELEAFRAVEKRVTRCMRERGFVYVSEARSGSIPSDLVGKDGQLDEKKLRKLYGFGISTIPPNLSLTASPNAPILATLSEVDRTAYFVAMYGYELPRQPRQGSCRGDAEEALYGPQRAIRPIESRLQAVLDRLDTTRAVRQSVRAFEECILKTAGVKVTGVSGPADYIVKKFNSAVSEDTTLGAVRDLEMKLARADTNCSRLLKPRTRARSLATERFLLENVTVR